VLGLSIGGKSGDETGMMLSIVQSGALGKIIYNMSVMSFLPNKNFAYCVIK
tara:strand:- start:362 stop:514 length:153 start_codon:yes stop_codon:yes gene_type:complete